MYVCMYVCMERYGGIHNTIIYIYVYIHTCKTKVTHSLRLRLSFSLSLSLAVATDRLRWGTCHTVRSSCTATYNESAKPNMLDLK